MNSTTTSKPSPFKVLVTDGLHPEIFSRLQAMESFDVHPSSKVRAQQLPPLLKQAQALVVRSATRVDGQLLGQAPCLELVIRAGEGMDNIDQGLCRDRGIKVDNTPGANNNSAAEHAIGLMLCVLRHTAQAHGSMLEGKWEKASFVGLELWKKKVGIVGMGRIGKLVAERLSGFGPEVVFFDPVVESFPQARRAHALRELFSFCDVITLHVPYSPETQAMVGKDLLGAMGPGAILINVARGGIVVEEDLAQALCERRIRGAGVDVYATEPLEESSPLRMCPNLVLTPHLGASTQEAQFRVGEMVLAKLKEFVQARR